jgi:RNA polymerase sigma-70 factor (ECF subfamily)
MFEKSQNFADVYRTNFASLYRSCLLRVRDRERVIDIVQDTFAKTWVYIVMGGTIRNEKAFLYRTMRNIIVSYYRTKKPFSLDELAENEAFDPPFQPNSSIEDNAEGHLAVDKLRDIPEKYKAIVIQHFMRGLSFREIAQVTAEAENTVIVRFHRAIKKMRVLFLR